MLESIGRMLWGPCVSPVPLPSADRQRQPPIAALAERGIPHDLIPVKLPRRGSGDDAISSGNMT
jgi:hypothetical protein